MFFLLFEQKLLDHILVMADGSLEWCQAPVCETVKEEQARKASQLRHSLRKNFSKSDWEGQRLFTAVDVDFHSFLKACVFLSKEDSEYKCTNRIDDFFD